MYISQEISQSPSWTMNSMLSDIVNQLKPTTKQQLSVTFAAFHEHIDTMNIYMKLNRKRNTTIVGYKYPLSIKKQEKSTEIEIHYLFR